MKKSSKWYGNTCRKLKVNQCNTEYINNFKGAQTHSIQLSWSVP